MAEEDRSSPPIPRTIGRYQIQSLIGSGAMGAVYKGFDPLIKRTLAIKTIRLDIPRGSDEYKTFLERFYQEARISGTLSHPNIVTLFDIGEENGVPFLALEFVAGETVEALLDKGVRFKPEKAIGLVSQIAAAIDYAHSKGVIHRDIKPANLLLYDEDKVKVTDFGIAKLADSEMTRQGQLLGTPSYMSPEQAMGEKLDGRSDIFSLGICAFEMLSGQQPFPGNNVTAILYKLVNVEPVHPNDLEMNGLIPQKWHEVFGKVLSKKREDRYQTAADFVRDLEYCLGSWFTGIESLAEEPEPQTIAMSAAELPAPPPVPEAPAPAAPPPVASRVPPPSPLAGRQADDPSIVVSFDEVTMPMPVPRMPPADEDELPETINLSAQRRAPDHEASEATMVVGGAGAPDEDELPPTIAIPRSRVEKTVLLPTPGTSPPAPSSTPPPVARQTASGSAKPGSLPPFKLKSPLPGRPGRLPGPSSRPPGPRSAPPGSLSMPPVEPEAPLVPTRKGLSAGVVIGGGAALLGGAILIGVLLFSRGQSGPAPDAAPSAETALLPAGNGSLVVSSQPGGAAVSVNGVDKGTAPVSVEGIALGTYEVVGRLAGHEPDVKSVTLDASAVRRDVNLSLSPSRTEMGEADILSRPAGASVVMDGAKIGLTPLRGFKLRVGTRQFELRTEGYEPWRGWLSVRPGETARLEARMLPEGQAPQSAPTTLAAASTAAPSEPPVPAAASAAPTPRPAATRSPRAQAATPEPTPVATPIPAPPTPAAAEPERPSVDQGRVYRENEVDAAPRKLSGDSYSPRLRSGETVSVTLSWVVSETGEVGEIEIVESGGKPLDDAVAAAILKWKYAPGAKQGVKVKVRMAPRKYTFRAG